MNKNLIPVIGIAVMLVIGLLVGVGYAIDASDGSIDALDDDKWAATGNDGVREPGDSGYTAPTTTVPALDRRAVEEAFVDGMKPYATQQQDLGVTKLELVEYGYSLCNDTADSIEAELREAYPAPNETSDSSYQWEYDRWITQTVGFFENVRSEAVWAGMCAT